MKREPPTHQGQFCPNRCETTTLADFPKRTWICACPIDEWPVSLVKNPKPYDLATLMARLEATKLSITVPMSIEQWNDMMGPILGGPYTPPKPHPWKARWARFRERLALKICPDIHEECNGW